ncbi:MAG TPA: MFS transporter [Candidatus Limnocylindria bacterium]
MDRSVWAPERRLLTIGLVFSITAVAFEGMAVPTVLPDTLDDLGGLALYGWAFSGFWLANLVGITLAGAESDRSGPWRPFALGTACFAVGLLVAAFAPNMAIVVAGRIIQGLGAGATYAVTYVAVARGYPAAAQPRMIAVISSAWVLPGLLGPAFAALLADQLSWRWVFAALAPLLPVVAIAMQQPLRRLAATAAAADADRPDPPAGLVRHARDGVVLAIGAGLLLAAPTSGQVWLGLLLAVGGLLLVRGPLTRLLPPGTLTGRPGRTAAIAAAGLLSVAFLGTEAFVPLAVASVRNAGIVFGGIALSAAAVTWSTGSWIQARIAAGGTRSALVTAGFALVLVGIGLETLVPLTSVSVWLALVAWAVAGLGMGLAYSTVTLVTLESAPPGEEGAASAALQLSNTLGIALGTGVAGGVVAVLAEGPGLAPGIGLANALMMVVCVVGIVVSLRVPTSVGSSG